MKNYSFLAIVLCAMVFVACNNTGGLQPNNGQVATSNNNGGLQPNNDQVATSNNNGAQQAVPQSATQVSVPDAITNFINSNFSGATITGTERDFDDGEIDVYLSDGSKVEFNSKNECKKITCPGKAVPAALVPPAIADYVKSNYQSSLISKIEKKFNSYEIELNNGMELHFGANGQFLGMDADD